MAQSDQQDPAARQRDLVARYLLIEDLQERLAAVVERGRKLPAIHAAQKVDQNLVPGCVSRVWLLHAAENARCHFRADADSTLVKGLVALVCEVYEGCPPSAVHGFETTILSELHLLDSLSPTRRNGIVNVALRIRELAGEQLLLPE